MKKLAKDRKQMLKKLLLDLREDFSKRIHHEMDTKKNELSDDRNQAPMDFGDLSSMEFEQSMESTLLNRETEIWNRIDLALERLKQGSYGICENCKKEISLARLRAMPFVEYCVLCQGSKEKTSSTPKNQP